VHRVEHVMGFPVSLRVDDAGVPGTAGDAVFAWLREVDERFSPFKPGSEVSRYGRGELAADQLSADLVEVLDLCERYRVATGGAFDARLPGRGLDPCAIVKGWSVQRAAELLRDAGARRFCLNAGGDVAAGPSRKAVQRHGTDTGEGRDARGHGGDAVGVEGALGAGGRQVVEDGPAAPEEERRPPGVRAEIASTGSGRAWSTAAMSLSSEVFLVREDGEVHAVGPESWRPARSTS
jgi:hypothetical protein